MITTKIDCTTLDVVCSPTDSALPGDLESFETADRRDQEREQRRLAHADPEMAHRGGVVKALQEHARRDIEREDADDRTAEDAGDHRDERQQRHRDQQRERARQHQHFDRIKAERANRVDLLARFHRSYLRGECAAGTAGDQDRGEQHAELAQERIADELDREHARAEVAQHGRAEERDDRADEETRAARRSAPRRARSARYGRTATSRASAADSASLARASRGSGR